MLNDGFKFMVITPPGVPNPSLAIAACRAGEIGVLDLQYSSDRRTAVEAIRRLSEYCGQGFAIKIDSDNPQWVFDLSNDSLQGLKSVIVPYSDGNNLKNTFRAFQKRGIGVLLESTQLAEAKYGQEFGVDGIIAKGHESGGRIGSETTFVLLQRFAKQITLPIWAHGGIGLHTAAACHVGGAVGVVLDAQLLLTRESTVPEKLKSQIGKMDGSEPICLGHSLGETYRIVPLSGSSAIKTLQDEEQSLTAAGLPGPETRKRWRRKITAFVNADSTAQQILPVGQDVAFAARLAERYVTVAGVIQGIKEAIDSHRKSARKRCILAEDSPLAKSHGTRYPIIQGPMARVSDLPSFVSRSAEHGALAFLAVAWTHGPELESILKQTCDQLAGRPWGVGLLGFLPAKVYDQQRTAILAYRPPFALIAGGRPDQCKALEQEGIATYVHVPSPGLLQMFIEKGVRRFVLEGRESGGHVGPRCSFVLWEQMIEVLLSNLTRCGPAEAFHVILAGGIHDTVSAAMAAVTAASLAERGCRIGVQMGSAYLVTREAVETGAIVEDYQQAVIDCENTVLLEHGGGHANRCIENPFARNFLQERNRLLAAGKSPEDIRQILDKMAIGRLQVATRGKVINPKSGKTLEANHIGTIEKAERWNQGMYMVGQVAALRNDVTTMAELHREVSKGGEALLQKHCDPIQPIAAINSQQRPSDIAIIGMACVLPKAPSLIDYWDNILHRVSAIEEVPPDRWDWRNYYSSSRHERDKVYSKWGAFIDPIRFEPLKYGMPPNSLRSIEPLQLITLDTAYRALEDAGYAQRPFPRERAAVILGISGTAELGQKYGFRSSLPTFLGDSSIKITNHFDTILPEWTEDSFPGILMNVTAGRIANRLDLGGPNFTVDGACASSLVAVYNAVRELETGASDLAIVGGADTMQNPFTYLCFSKTQALSPSGKSCPLGARADGIVIGEGIAVVVLKRLADAERDGDRIYAVIKGVGAASDGRDKSLTAPRQQGQVRALERAYSKAGLSPAAVGLVEMHATGTTVGDRTEVEALTELMNRYATSPQNCAIGSVKSMIGHTKSTAGLASLIKSALALYHKVLPPTLNAENPIDPLQAPTSPLYVSTDTRPWFTSSRESCRRAGVSAFGFGGTNFHVVLEEYTRAYTNTASDASFQRWPAELFIWQDHSRQGLLAAIHALEKALQSGANPPLRNLAYSINRSCAEKVHSDKGKILKLVIVASSLQDLKQKLGVALPAISRSISEFENPTGIYFREHLPASPEKIAFLFPGQGSQYPNMLADLAIQFPAVRDIFDRSDRILRKTLPKPLTAYVFPPSACNEAMRQVRETALAQTNIAQAAMGTADLAVFHLLREFGIVPDMVAGHSYGEYVALCAAGVIQEADLIRLSEARGRFIMESAQNETGTMAAVAADARTVSEAIQALDGVVIANINSPKQTVVSGTEAAVDRALEQFRQIGIKARRIAVSCAFHSSLVAPARKMLKRYLADVPLIPPKLPVYSNLDGQLYPSRPERIASQLADHLINKVEFVREIESIYAAGARIFIECGPGRVLTSLVDRILGDRPHVNITADAPGRSSLLQLNHLLGKLLVQGVPVEIDRIHRGRAVSELNLENLTDSGSGDSIPIGTWLVDGGRAMPVQDSLSAGSDHRIHPLEILVGKSEPEANPDESSQPGLPQSPPASGFASSPPPAPPPDNTDRSPYSPPSAETAPSGAPGRDPILIRFQQMMTRFLDTQHRVMQTYLHAGAPAETSTSDFGRTSALAAMETAPANADNSRPALENDRPETGTGEKRSSAPVPGPGDGAANTDSEQTATAKGQTDTIPEAFLVSELMRLLGERTGYPVEMLNLDQNLEADLGIDSIKRIEILGSFIEVLPSDQRHHIENETERLAAQKTMRGIIEWVQKRIQSADDPANQLPQQPEPDRIEPPADGKPKSEQIPAVARFALKAAPLPSCPPAKSLPVRGVIVITEDADGLAERLASALTEMGHEVVRIRFGDGSGLRSAECYQTTFETSQEVSALLENVRNQHGPIGGLVHLLPLCNRTMPAEIDLSGWKTLLRLQIKSLFYLLKATATELKEAADHGGACVLAATALGEDLVGDGAAGNVKFFPGHGGIAGLLKSVALEWPTVTVKALNFGSTDAEADMVAAILAEMGCCDQIVEIGYHNGRRKGLQPEPTPLRKERPAAPVLESTQILLVTGGARGITAEVTCALARKYQPTILLVGRSPIPATKEAPETEGITAPAELKAVLIAKMKSENTKFSLSQVESAYNRLLKEREMRKNLADMRRSGAKVEYFQVDVCDEQQFSECIEHVYDVYGNIDGVIHGAGVIEDRFLIDKGDRSFDRVFDTKVDSAFTLSRKLRAEALKFLVFFTSVAGRFGNRGQADYAAANEVLNKLALLLDSRWPGRVVSINWGPWAKTGMVNPQLEKQFAEKGVELVPPEVGVRRFDQELTHGRKGEVEIILGGIGWNQQPVSKPSKPAQYLPLLAYNISKQRRSQDSILLTKRLDPDLDLYLKDHVLDGRPVLPAAVALELMTEAVADVCPEFAITGIMDFRVFRGVVIDRPDKFIVVSMQSMVESTDSRIVKVSISDLSDSEKIFYGATFECNGTVSTTERLSRIDGEVLQSFPMTVEEAYDRWLFHGPIFKGIQEIQGIGPEGVRAKVRPSVPEQCLSRISASRWLIDPVAMDSGFQLVILWARMYRDLTPLPSQCRRYDRFGEIMGESVDCEISILPHTGNHTILFDMCFFDHGGQILGRMENMTFTCSKSLNRLAGQKRQVTIN